jgi:hypothetical protein
MGDALRMLVSLAGSGQLNFQGENRVRPFAIKVFSSAAWWGKTPNTNKLYLTFI